MAMKPTMHIKILGYSGCNILPSLNRPRSSLYKPRIETRGFLVDSRPLKMGPIVCPETSV